jgi:hypothetical protein
MKRLQAIPEVARIMAFTLISGFITHGFFYANTLLAHDCIKPYGVYFSVLRWSTLLFYFPRAFLLLPWVIGLISMAELGVVNILIARMFSIRKLGNQLLLVITTVTFPSVIAFHNFGAVDLFTGSLMFAVIAAYFFSKKGFGNSLLSVAFLTISIASYQAFLCATAALMLMLLLAKVTIRREKLNHVLLNAGKALLILASSVVIYFAVYLILKNLGLPGVTDYRNQDAIGVFTAQNLWDWTLQTYKTALVYYLGDHPNPLPFFIQAFELICVVIVLICTISRLGKQRFFQEPARLLLATSIVLMLPLAINVIQLLNNGNIPHQLMTFAFIVPWILVLQYGEWLTEQSEGKEAFPKKLQKGLAILCALLICANAYYCYIVANANYLNRKLNYDASLSLATRLVDRIENIEGYTPETPVVFSGELYSGYMAHARLGFDLVQDVVASYSYTGQAMTYNNAYGSTVQWFITTALSSNIQFVPADQIEYYSNLDAVKNMEQFPSQNCYTWVGGVLVLKLNN